METISIPVRTALMPLCYKDFHCLAGACRNNCCHGWEISFRKKDYLKIKRAAKSDKMKQILAKGLSRLRGNAHDGCYAHFNAGPEENCAFLTAEGLCLLQLEFGAEVLPKVCREYPRTYLYTSRAKECALGPSCEGVLVLLWDLPQGIDFWEEPLPKRDWMTANLPPRMARFADIRSFCIDVLQERSLPFPQRMMLLGLMFQRLVKSDWGEEGIVDEWLSWGKKQLRDPPENLKNLPHDLRGFLSNNVRILLDLYERNAAGSRELYRSLFSAISLEENWEEKGLSEFSIDLARYRRLEEQLGGLLDHSDYFFENLMVITAFYITFPALMKPEDPWNSYTDLCVLYSFFRFAAVCGCRQEASQERLFHVISVVSRGLLHNAGYRERLFERLFINGNRTMIQMAILTNG